MSDILNGRREPGESVLRALGFRKVVSLDLSPRLLRAHGHATARAVADCRTLPVASRSIDIAIVQGGLHHLPGLPDDLEATLAEVARALRPTGIFVVVEPWRTPFLDFVHWICRQPLARKAFAKLDALATMIELEQLTYDQWLERPREILALIDRYFVEAQRRTRMGKILYVGHPRAR
jgi:SAM-dependent methyltransferase